MLWEVLKNRTVGDVLLLILFYLVAGFVVGSMFSEHISFQLSETNWGNLWVYLWLLFWPEFVIALALWYFMWAFLALIILAGIVGLWQQNR